MAGGGVRETGNSVTLRKISLFCNILLALMTEGQLLLIGVPLRVDGKFLLA
jgi:hypothetical protein